MSRLTRVNYHNLKAMAAFLHQSFLLPSSPPHRIFNNPKSIWHPPAIITATLHSFSFSGRRSHLTHPVFRTHGTNILISPTIIIPTPNSFPISAPSPQVQVHAAFSEANNNNNNNNNNNILDAPPHIVQQFLVDAAIAKNENSPRVPKNEVAKALKRMEALMKKSVSKESSTQVHAILCPEGPYNLVLTTKKSKAATNAPISGSYFPLPAGIAFYHDHDQQNQSSPDRKGSIVNAANIGPISLRFDGRFKWVQKQRRILFNFYYVSVSVGPWKLINALSIAKDKKFKEIPDDQYFQNNEDPRKLPFFTFFFTHHQAAAARGRGGGLALWTSIRSYPDRINAVNLLPRDDTAAVTPHSHVQVASAAAFLSDADQLFMFTALDAKNKQDVRAKNRQNHIEYALESNRFALLGPLIENGNMIGSFGVAKALDMNDIQNWLSNDPYCKADLFQSVAVNSWKRLFVRGELKANLFVLCCLDKPDALSLRLQTRSDHLQWWENANRSGWVGPLIGQQGSPVGSLLLVDGSDMEEVRAWSQTDPYYKAGLFEKVEIYNMRKVIEMGQLKI